MFTTGAVIVSENYKEKNETKYFKEIKKKLLKTRAIFSRTMVWC